MARATRADLPGPELLLQVPRLFHRALGLVLIQLQSLFQSGPSCDKPGDVLTHNRQCEPLAVTAIGAGA